MSTSTQCAIGLDVGGTKIAAGVITLSEGRTMISRVVPSLPERGGAMVLGDAVDLINSLHAQACTYDLDVIGVGLSICELVDPFGQITSAHTLDWRGLDIRQSLAHIAPLQIEADVRAHALGEARLGAGRDLRQFVFVSVGTGISSCLVQDGKPFSGARGNALILASAPFTTTCTHCGEQTQIVLEEYASGPALAQRYRQIGGSAHNGQDVTEAAGRGDEVARHILRTAGEALGVSIGWLVNVLDPEAVIVGGGLGSLDGLYWDAMITSARSCIWVESSRDLPIVHAILATDAGWIGAAIGAAERFVVTNKEEIS